MTLERAERGSGMKEAIASYLAASEANDLDALMEAIAPDAELLQTRSPA